MFRATLRHLVHALVYGTAGLLIGGLGVFIVHQLDRPDLQPWHLAELDTEFTAADAGRVKDLDGYRQLENELFEQVQTQVYERIGEQNRRRLNRYYRGSWSDPKRFKTDWNRTFELSAEQPRAAVLMLHGMSDSPYSLRTLGQSLHERGASVIGLRLPGHGTAPVGLTRARWEDAAAAVRLAAKDLRAKTGDEVALYLVGYSNGAALAIEYTLGVLEGEALPRPAGLVLISPAVAVSPAAALARFNLWLAKVPGLQKLAWLDIQPEYDPFKYNSFPVNAGEQVFRITSSIGDRLNALKGDKPGVEAFPPVLAFQSIVDTTVSTPALIEQFLNKLAADGHELVLFDVNRESESVALLSRDPAPLLASLLKDDSPFGLSLVTNRNADSSEVVVKHHPAGRDTGVNVTELGLSWPLAVYSLSHVALPFAPDDPLYGELPEGSDRAMTLGSLEPRGERSQLQVSIGALMRLRYNPFFELMETRLIDVLGLSDTAHDKP